MFDAKNAGVDVSFGALHAVTIAIESCLQSRKLNVEPAGFLPLSVELIWQQSASVPVSTLITMGSTLTKWFKEPPLCGRAFWWECFLIAGWGWKAQSLKIGPRDITEPDKTLANAKIINLKREDGIEVRVECSDQKGNFRYKVNQGTM